MNVYKVGPDDPYDLPDDNDEYVWLVHSYTEGSYEGNGEAVALHKDGTLRWFNLSHCSCYGPFDEWSSGGKILTPSEALGESDSVLDLEVGEEIRSVVRGLL